MYPILVDLGVWQLRSYGVFVAVAIVVGVWWSARDAERRGFARCLVHDAAWIIALAGFAGARLWYVLFSEPKAFLAISVALVVAALASLVVLRRRVWRVQQPAAG